MVERVPVGPVVDVGLLGDRQPGAVGLDQAEPDELTVLDDVVEPVGGHPQPVGGQGVEVIAARDDLRGAP